MNCADDDIPVGVSELDAVEVLSLFKQAVHVAHKLFRRKLSEQVASSDPERLFWACKFFSPCLLLNPSSTLIGILVESNE